MEEYEDISEQRIDAVFAVNTGALSSTSIETFSQRVDFEVPEAGGLDKNERAELVGWVLEDVSVIVEQEASAGTEPGTARIGCELVFAQPGIGAITEVNQGDAGTDGQISVDVVEENNPFISRAEARTESPFNDTTNGSGGGGAHQRPTYLDEMWYRDHFGRGPVIDRFQDVIELVMSMRTVEMQNEGVNASVAWRLYWNVFEEE